MNKTILTVLLVSSLLFACGQTPVAKTPPPPPSPPVEQPANPQPNPDPQPSPQPSPQPNPTPPPAPDPDPTPLEPPAPPPAPDTTAPTIASSSPAGGANGVAINSNILVSFSEAMNPGSVTVSLNPSVNLGAATWKSENSAVQFDPPADLAGDTPYTVTVTGKDVAGNNLSGSGTFQFRTATIRDTTAPGIPQNLNAEAGDGGVKLAWNANAESDLKGYTLHYGTDAGNLANNTFISKPGTSKTITGLTNGTKYYFALDAEDSAGNRSGRSSTVSATPRDSTAPKLVSSSPGNGASNVNPASRVVFNFSEPMNTENSKPKRPCAFIPPAAQDSVCGTLESAVWSDNDKKLTLTYIAAGGGLGNKDELSFIFDTATDKAGNPLPATTVKFRVGDVIAPSIRAASPAANTVGVPVDGVISVSFSEPMDRASTQAAFQVNFGLLGLGAAISGTFAWDGADTSFVFRPNSVLPFGEFAVYKLLGTAKDKAGNAIGTELIRGLRVIQQVTAFMPYYGSGHILRTCVGSVTACIDDTAYTNEGVIRVGDRKVTLTGSFPTFKNKFEYSRGYLAFKINTIPRNATLTAARLRIFHKSTGGDPFGQLGTLYLERVNPDQTIEQAYRLSGDRGDFNLPSLPCASCPRALGGVNIDENVLDFVNADRNSGGAGAQFRLRFANLVADANTADYLDFFQNPTLVVTYQFP